MMTTKRVSATILVFIITCLNAIYSFAGSSSVVTNGPMLEMLKSDCSIKHTVSDEWLKLQSEPSDSIWTCLNYNIGKIDTTTMTSNLEHEINAEFVKEPTVPKALFLGLCHDTNSLQTVITSRILMKDQGIVRALNVALSRRINKPNQDIFINEFYSDPACSNYYVMQMGLVYRSTGGELMLILQYIHSPETYLALLEQFIVSPDKVTPPKDGWLFAHEMPFDVARHYLKLVGIEMPLNMNQAQRIEWWFQNKRRIFEKLQSAKPLPDINLPLMTFAIS